MKTPSVVNKYTPLSNVPKEKLSSSLKASRKELRDRENEAKAKQFKEVLKVEGVNVSDELHKTYKTVLDKTEALFWQEQVKAFANSDARGMRWHPIALVM